MIQVEGLKEFRQALKAVDADRELGKAHKVISKFAADKAESKRERLETKFGSYKKMRGNIRPSSAATAARVRLVSKADSGRLGPASEFGAKNHPLFGVSMPQASFKKRVWPQWSRKGHMIYPAVEENQDEIFKLYGDAVDEMVKRVFPEGSRGI